MSIFHPAKITASARSILKSIPPLVSQRLTLISSSAEHVRTELTAPEKLSEMLSAIVSPAWPSGEYDKDAMEFFLERFESGGEASAGWYGWYALATDAGADARVLVGAGGYFGPPDEDGSVEVGYSVLPEWQRRGYALDMVSMLLRHAASFQTVQKFVAHTAPHNTASINVLIKSGFREVGTRNDDGALRFERSI